LITAHPIDLSSTDNPELTFWHKIGVEKYDHGYVDISEDGGITWTNLADFTNTWRSTWTLVPPISLSDYKASPVKIRFRLRSNGSYQTWGWDIDDVNVTGTVTASGACIMPDGSCVEFTEQNCTACGGTYQGDGTECTPCWTDSDFNCDGIVNYSDLGLLADHWLFTEDDPAWDASYNLSIVPEPSSGKEIINYLDLGIFADHWLEEIPCP